MEKHRQISTYFWTDIYIEELDPIEKLLFIYLFTNQSSNLAGIYQLSMRTMASETGIDRDMVKKIIGRFEKDGKVLYEDNYIAIKNTAESQNTNNYCIMANIKKVLDVSPKWAVDFISFNKDSLRTPQGLPNHSDKSKSKSKSKSKDKSIVLEVLIEKWNSNGYGSKTTLTDKRKGKLKTRLKEKEFDIDKIIAKVNIVKDTDFIKNSSWFTFDWIIKDDTNYIKLLEGNYDPKGKTEVKDCDIIQLRSE